MSTIVLMALLWLPAFSSPAAPAAAAQASSAEASTLCPAGSPSTARPVFRALSQERLGWFRRMYGLNEVEPRSLRPVQNPEACVQLSRLLQNSVYGQAPWAPAYYQAGGFYFIALRDTTDPRQGRRKVDHFFVYDASLRPIAHLAPR
jgi:hypothetical protein